MNPGRFLAIGGTTLMTIGTLGVTGHLGSISRASFFRPPHWINWVHLGVGASVLGIVALGGKRLQAAVALFAGVMGTTLGLGGLLAGRRAADRFHVPELADPSDHAAHLAVGLLALWGWRGRAHPATPVGSSPQPSASARSVT